MMVAAQIIPSTSGKFQKVYAGSINSDNNIVNPATEEKQDDIIANLEGIAGLVTLAYDYIDITYTGVNATTVVFKTGGSEGTTVATLTITYDANNNPLTITKT